MQTIRLHALVKEECSQYRAEKKRALLNMQLNNRSRSSSDRFIISRLPTVRKHVLSENCRKRFSVSELRGTGLIKQKTYLIQFNPTRTEKPRILDVCVAFVLCGIFLKLKEIKID